MQKNSISASSNQRVVRSLLLYDVTRVSAKKQSYESNLGALQSQQQRAADVLNIAAHALPTLEANGENTDSNKPNAMRVLQRPTEQLIGRQSDRRSA